MENQVNEHASGRGGARQGAGRKAKEHGRAYSFYSTLEAEAILESLGGGKSAFINEAIVFYHKHKQ